MNKLRCVVADDSKITRDRVGAYLQIAGYEVLAKVRDGKRAYELCHDLRPDIAILDISMPIMNGDVAGLQIMKEKLARFVVIASSQMQAATVDQLLEAGCKVISKPFRQEKFLASIEQIVGDS